MSFVKFTPPAVDTYELPAIDLFSRELSKYASRHYLPPKVEEYLKTAEPIDGGRVILVHGLGSDEVWGCFVPGTPVMMADGTERPIEEIQEGDVVLTHKGRPRRVTKRMEREASTLLVGVNIRGSEHRTWMTPEHPVLIADREQFACLRDKYKRCTPDIIGEGHLCNRGTGCERDELPELKTEWKKAGELEPGDFVLYVTPEKSGDTLLPMSPDMASLLGYYGAEGNLIRLKSGALSGVELTFCAEELDYVRKVTHLVKKLGMTMRGPYFRVEHDNTVRIHITSPEFAATCLKYVGQYSRQKRLSPELANLTGPAAFALIGAWIDGDGTVNEHGRLAIDTRSEEAGRGLWHLCRRNGIGAVIQSYAVEHGTGYRVSFTATEADVLREYTNKFRDIPRLQMKSWTFNHGGYRLCPIVDIERLDYNGPVHNLEVDEDHTYVVDGFAVHNCNNNGDSFPEYMINDDGVKEATLINAEPKNDWGYITFEKYAHSFADHVNNHPNNTIGGKVILADWNPEMHRVEIVMPINPKMAKTASARHKAEEAIQKIDRGEPIDVSMGCFIAGTLITMADGSRKPIEEIQLGDYVMTHKGRARKVTELHKRPYDGVFFMIRPEAHEPFVCTQEHPLLVVDRDDVKKGKSGGPRWVSQEEAAHIDPKWIHAECFDPEQHYLLEPVLQDVLTPEYATREFARLLGYYVAEGHVLRNKTKEICGVEFTVNRSDTFLTEIGELAEKYGTKNPPVMRQRDNCEDAVSVQIFDAELASRLYAHGGSYAKQKKLSESFMQWHSDIQREFVGAWAEGDGHGLESGALSISTGSDALAWQLMTVLARMDICASINCLTHKAGSGFSKKATYEWVIHIGKQWAQGLHDVCLKIKDSPVLLAKNSRMHTGKFIITPVREMEASRNSVDVYNFEVEEDESYVAAGVAVHNCKVAYDVCKICKNKAKNRSEYCDHAKYAMGRVMSDGRRVGVDNPRPKFFDISYVKRGADRAAKLLMKVASTTTVVRVPDWPDRDKKAGKKISTIKKQVPMSGVDPITALADRAEVDVLKNVVPFDMSTANELPPKVARLFQVYPAADVVSTLTAMGVVLLPHEIPEKVAGEHLYAKEPSTGILSDIDIQDLMVKRSMYTPFLVMRVTRKADLSGLGRLKVASDMTAESAAIERYSKYVNFLKTAFRDASRVDSWNQMVQASHRIVESLASESDKVIGLWKGAGLPELSDDMRTLLGAEWVRASSVSKVALAKGWSELGTKIAAPTMAGVKDYAGKFVSGVKSDIGGVGSLAKGLGSKALSVAKPVTDIAGTALGLHGQSPYPASALLAYGGAPLVMSSFFADKMRRGEDPGTVGRFVAKHPLASSAGSVLGSLWLHRAMRNLH